jgi:diaminopimelate epimerase
MELEFCKMQGIGNDYVYIDCFRYPAVSQLPPEAISSLARRVSDRHFGVGSDGLILICPSDTADVRMRMYNADGSEGNMCGNGIRCVGKFTYEKGLCRKPRLAVETRSGVKSLELRLEGDTVARVRVDMGRPALEAEKIPARASAPELVGYPVEIGGAAWRITCVSMGNPHAVVFVDPKAGGGIDGLDLPKIGPLFEHHALFPEGVNTEFVEVLDPRTLRMRVWERGSGETLACGTGACASAVAACKNGFSPRGEEIRVRLRGGELGISWETDRVLMTGPAAFVFTGRIDAPELGNAPAV